jgi:Na+-transporting NADH:ubiquinone oxidoreductase subunit A
MALSTVHRIKKGLDVPISGEPVQEIHDAPQVTRVAAVALPFHGLRPTMHVQEGDQVKRGTLLYENKKNPGERHTAPAAGTVVAVNRGERRALQTVVIELNDRERAGTPSEDDFQPFESYSGRDLAGLSRDDLKALLQESGLWTCLRTRPFSKVPAPDSEPAAIFITAMDTNPLTASVEKVLAGNEADFERGCVAVAKLTDHATFLCKAEGAAIPSDPNVGVDVQEFAGPHPAGLAGTHIHLLKPAHRDRIVWSIGYQDVLAIGRLLKDGRLPVERIVALGGPQVKNPRLLRTRSGASLSELTAGEVHEGENRVISGSVLSGRAANGDVLGYLDPGANQVSVLLEGREREFIGWMAPGPEKFSVLNLFISKLKNGSKRFDLTTSTGGSPRAMVPMGTYEDVMPLDLMPTHLLRAMIVHDLERVEELGGLELDEEDVALCTFVCPGKYDYCDILRENLTRIEKEG